DLSGRTFRRRGVRSTRRDMPNTRTGRRRDGTTRVIPNERRTVPLEVARGERRDRIALEPRVRDDARVEHRLVARHRLRGGVGRRLPDEDLSVAETDGGDRARALANQDVVGSRRRYAGAAERSSK